MKLSQGGLLKRLSSLKPRRPKFPASLAQDFCSWVFCPVDAVPESHQAVSAVEGG